MTTTEATRSATAMAAMRRMSRSRLVPDVLLWIVITAPVPLHGESPELPGLPLSWLRIAAVPLLGLAVLVARRLPVAAAAVPLTLSLAATPELYSDRFLLAQLVLTYLLGRRWARQRPALLLFGAVCAVGLLVIAVLPRATFMDGISLVGSVLLSAVLPWLAGRYMRQRAELVRTGWQLAERLERERQLVGEQERLRERARIARDMHDSLGHDLTLIALRAAALQVSPGLGETERRAAGDLREAAAVATERLRDVIGMLREEGEGAPVRPVLDTVESLVARAATSGMKVTLADGLGPARPGGPPMPLLPSPPLPPLPSPPLPSPPSLPPMTDRAIYRVVQEALTNATRHAPGAPVTVTLCREGDEAVVTVVNEAPPTGPTAPPPTGGPKGYGLIGLDERVRLAGGTLRAVPTAGGVGALAAAGGVGAVPTAEGASPEGAGEGFTVTARLPLAPGTAATPPGVTGPEPRDVAAVRRRARRSMTNAIWAPVAVAAAVLLLVLGDVLYGGYSALLDKDAYEQLHIGERQASVQDGLPQNEADGGGRPQHAPADPRGTDECRFYRTSAFDDSSVYRLCFTDGRLSHKDEMDVGD